MPKRILQGVVVSKKSQKTAVVKVERRYVHPVYHKTVGSSKKYHAHDELDLCLVGEKVSIIESRPYSKLKRWTVVSSKVVS